MESTKLRRVTGIVESHESKTGEWRFRRTVPGWAFERSSPFLALEHIGPVTIDAGAEEQAQARPRRGYEAVTMLFSGALQHTDSKGNDNLLLAGDVLWITAGKGIVHSEFRPEAFQKTGGLYHTLHFWVNLPRAYKMADPKCQDVKAAFIPITKTEDEDVTIRVISGDFLGARGPVATYTSVLTLHVMLRGGSKVTLPLPEGHNVMSYMATGAGRLNDEQKITEGELALFASEGQGISIAVVEDTCLVILAGEAIREPVVRHGSFVMNSESEIVQTLNDYRRGKLWI